jgi:hypothetical protein
MSKTEIIRDVPTQEKARLQKQYEELGAIVVWSDQGGGKWTLTATFPSTAKGPSGD